MGYRVRPCIRKGERAEEGGGQREDGEQGEDVGGGEGCSCSSSEVEDLRSVHKTPGLTSSTVSEDEKPFPYRGNSLHISFQIASIRIPFLTERRHFSQCRAHADYFSEAFFTEVKLWHICTLMDVLQ